MRVDSRTLQSLINSYTTPLYIYHAGTILEKCNLFKQLTHCGVQILYSIKANPCIEVCQLISNQRLSAEIASRGELEIALRCGFDLSTCMTAGPGKTQQDLEKYIDAGIGYINCESLKEANLINRIGIEKQKKVKVNLRVNPKGIGAGSKIKMGGRPSPFGIDEEEMEQVLRSMDGLAMVDLCGIHVYSGTQFLDKERILENFNYILDLGVRFSYILQRPPSMINFGGGFGVPFCENDPVMNEQELVADLSVFFEKARQIPSFYDTKFVIELGRYLVSESGYFVCSVVDIKMSRGIKFIVIDGGINNHMSLSPNFRFGGKNPAIIVLSRNDCIDCNEGGEEVVDIVGPLCTSLDCLARRAQIPATRINDIIVFPNSGAYALSMSPSHFLSHDIPKEILV